MRFLGEAAGHPGGVSIDRGGAADSAWEATLLVEALPQTVQVDALHLFSIGEASHGKQPVQLCGVRRADGERSSWKLLG